MNSKKAKMFRNLNIDIANESEADESMNLVEQLQAEVKRLKAARPVIEIPNTISDASGVIKLLADEAECLHKKHQELLDTNYLQAQKLGDYKDQVARLQAEAEQLRGKLKFEDSFEKNGFECFMSPCNKHSGVNTPPFGVWKEKYGGKCLPCLVDACEVKNKRIKELEAGLESVLTAYRVVVEWSDTKKPRKLDEALTWRDNDELVHANMSNAVIIAQQLLNKGVDDATD